MHSKKKILIVDENSSYISNLRSGLNEEGYEVIYWDNSLKAFETVKELHPDIILSDIESPDIQGQKFYEQLKAIPEARNIPFVFLSGQRRVEERIKSIEKGVDDFIIKPFYVEEVIARITNLLNEVKSYEESRFEDERAFAGDLTEMNLIDLIEILQVGGKSGIIKLKFGPYIGTVYVHEGRIADATLENLLPEEALMKMFLWLEGKFSVEITDIERPPAIENDTKSLVSDGMRHLRRWKELIAGLPSLETNIMVNQSIFSLENLSNDEKEVTKILSKQPTIYDVVIKSPFDPIHTIKIVKKLLDRNYIRECPPQENKQPRVTSGQMTMALDTKSKKEKYNKILSNLLNKPTKQNFYPDRRNNQRRRINDRRTNDRRKDHRTQSTRVSLDKSELMLIREKLS